MTKEELCIKACRYAIGELIRKGSSSCVISTHEGRQRIDWLDVVDYLDKLKSQYHTKQGDIENYAKNDIETTIQAYFDAQVDTDSIKTDAISGKEG